MEYKNVILSVVYYLLPLAASEDGTENFTVAVGYCISCNQTRGLISTGLCPYHFMDLELISIGGKYGIANYILPDISSCSMLNDAMCRHLNRDGLLCSKCKAGYGPALYSRTWKCETCNDRRYLMWTLLPFSGTHSFDGVLHHCDHFQRTCHLTTIQCLHFILSFFYKFVQFQHVFLYLHHQISPSCRL